MNKETEKSRKTLFNKPLGERIQARRVECDLSTQDVDRLMPVRKGTTRGFESGERFVSSEPWFHLSKILSDRPGS